MNALLDRQVKHDNPTFAKGKITAQINRNTASADISRLALPNGGIFLCITVYNEPADALYSSLAGLAKSIALLRRTYSNIVVNICILVDGLQQCSPSMRTTLERILGSDERFSESHDLTCHHSKLDLCDLSAFAICKDGHSDDAIHWQRNIVESQILASGAQEEFRIDNTVHLLLAVKLENRGKLDSHWWFYRVFCPRFIPTYCFQMDGGTVPTAQAFHELIEAFQRDSRVGAVASGILSPRPSSAWNLLECWQFASFANSILLEWPAENAAGYLSVIPGQLSAVRWDAIAGRDTLDRDSEPRDPLNIYFKGLGPLTPYESMLYLAEDRVLCREIVSNPQTEWTISHIDNALAITDPCHSWEELLRQRKRWHNGYMACRVSYVRNLPTFIRNPSVATRRKLRAATAGIYHSLVLAYDWCTPAIFVLFSYSLAQQTILLEPHIPVMQGSVEIAFYTALCALLVQFFVCCRGDLSARSMVFFRFSIALQASVVAVSLLINVLFGKSILLLPLLLFLCAAAPLASLIGHRRLTSTILASTPIVFSTIYVVPLLMWMYAICNAHDSSWGTKGLLTAARKAGQEAPRELLQKSLFLRFRNLYVSTWLGSNLCLAFLVDRWCRSNHYDILILLLAITSAIPLFGLVCKAGARLSRAWQSATGDAKHVSADSVKAPDKPIPSTRNQGRV
jgi:cellulose synthase/poly-beta-1,6-N-acetylglucosamine synthase-like glycosyltransferase